MGQLLWLERLLEEETTALRRQGRKPTKVLIRAAAKLDMSESSAWRLKAELDQANTIDLSTTPLGAWLRELRDDAAAQEAMSRFFDSTFL